MSDSLSFARFFGDHRLWTKAAQDFAERSSWYVHDDCGRQLRWMHIGLDWESINSVSATIHMDVANKPLISVTAIGPNSIAALQKAFVELEDSYLHQTLLSA
jgi:hypothetical protein